MTMSSNRDLLARCKSLAAQKPADRVSLWAGVPPAGERLIESAPAFLPSSLGQEHCGVLLTGACSEMERSAVTHLLAGALIYHVSFEEIMTDGDHEIALFKVGGPQMPNG
jgi:hypothetical protein